TIVPQPRADLVLQPAKRGRLKIGGRARSGRGVVWLRKSSGSLLFLGMEELASNAPFPVTSESFVQAVAPTELEALDTASALDDGGWDGLTALYEVLFRCEFFNTRLAAADELNRLTEKSERERRATEQALSTLASIVHPRRAEFTDLPADDPL